MRRKN